MDATDATSTVLLMRCAPFCIRLKYSIAAVKRYYFSKLKKKIGLNFIF